jgi:hypothetical protein
VIDDVTHLKVNKHGMMRKDFPRKSLEVEKRKVVEKLIEDSSNNERTSSSRRNPNLQLCGSSSHRLLPPPFLSGPRLRLNRRQNPLFSCLRRGCVAEGSDGCDITL